MSECNNILKRFRNNREMDSHRCNLSESHSGLCHCYLCHMEWNAAELDSDIMPNSIHDGPTAQPNPNPAAEPIPLLIWCPMCKERHIDRSAFATKPHHTHACQNCGHVWRPAIVSTVGVRFLPGFEDGSSP